MDRKRVTRTELMDMRDKLRNELTNAKVSIAHHMETADEGNPCMSCHHTVDRINKTLRETA